MMDVYFQCIDFMMNLLIFFSCFKFMFMDIVDLCCSGWYFKEQNKGFKIFEEVCVEVSCVFFFCV